MQNQINHEKQLYFNFPPHSACEKSAKEQFRDLGRRKKLSIQTVAWLDNRRKKISALIISLEKRNYSPVVESRIEKLNLSLISIKQKLLLEFKWHDKLMEEAYNHLPYFDYD